MLLLDTDFLIDLQREAAGRRKTGASDFLERSSGQKTAIALVTWMEFAEGFDEEDAAVCRKLLAPFQLIVPDRAIAWRASRISRRLRNDGAPIGDNDLWVAATALERELALVTRNVRHFRRVRDLRIVSY